MDSKHGAANSINGLTYAEYNVLTNFLSKYTKVYLRKLNYLLLMSTPKFDSSILNQTGKITQSFG